MGVVLDNFKNFFYYFFKSTENYYVRTGYSVIERVVTSEYKIYT